jgi:hypothetical protein
VSVPPPSNPRRSIFDLGPQQPRELDAPLDPPDARSQADMVLYEEDMVRRARLLREYGAERTRWLEQNGGPVELDMYAIDAARTLQRDPRRYVEKLPEGVEVGPKHGGDRVVFH